MQPCLLNRTGHSNSTWVEHRGTHCIGLFLTFFINRKVIKQPPPPHLKHWFSQNGNIISCNFFFFFHSPESSSSLVRQNLFPRAEPLVPFPLFYYFFSLFRFWEKRMGEGKMFTRRVKETCFCRTQSFTREHMSRFAIQTLANWHCLGCFAFYSI